MTGHTPDTRSRVRAWPVLLLALPAFVAIWSGWVGLGRLTGFGPVDLLPGIWAGARIDSSITLPIGMEAYAAYALHVWLSAVHVAERARVFARWSAIGSLILGASGQVAYHLMVAAGVTGAPWQITALVACLPVAVLGMGAALAHLVRESVDTVLAGTPDVPAPVPVPVSAVVTPPRPVPVLAVSAPATLPPSTDTPASTVTGARSDTVPEHTSQACTCGSAPGLPHLSLCEHADTGTPSEHTPVPVPRHTKAQATAACTSTPQTVREHVPAPDTDTPDTVLVDTLRVSGTRTLRGAMKELGVGQARARRVLALAWPDTSTGCVS